MIDESEDAPVSDEENEQIVTEADRQIASLAEGETLLDDLDELDSLLADLDEMDDLFTGLGGDAAPEAPAARELRELHEEAEGIGEQSMQPTARNSEGEIP
jgi:hypothetical protein